MNNDDLTNNIDFYQATSKDEPLIHRWLEKPHIAPLWDEQTDHPEGGLTRKDLRKYISGEPSIFIHWIATFHDEPFAYIMLQLDASTYDFYKPFVSEKGKTSSFDFLIGEESFLGKGLSYRTLEKFCSKLPAEIKAVLIDPDPKNEKAIHIYEKAGFIKIGSYNPDHGPFEGEEHTVLRKDLSDR